MTVIGELSSSVYKIAKPCESKLQGKNKGFCSTEEFFLVPEGVWALSDATGALCLHQLEDFVYSPHPLVVGDDECHTKKGRHAQQRMKT